MGALRRCSFPDDVVVLLNLDRAARAEACQTLDSSLAVGSNLRVW
jgi:hypothetical protein